MRIAIGITALITAIFAVHVSAQEREAKVSSTPNFSGVLSTGQESQWHEVGSDMQLLSVRPRADGAEKAAVSSEKTIVPNNFKLELKAKDNEAIIVQLLAGEISTERETTEPARNNTGVWVINPGEGHVLITGDDSAILRVTRINRP